MLVLLKVDYNYTVFVDERDSNKRRRRSTASSTRRRRRRRNTNSNSMGIKRNVLLCAWLDEVTTNLNWRRRRFLNYMCLNQTNHTWTHTQTHANRRLQQLATIVSHIFLCNFHVHPSNHLRYYYIPNAIHQCYFMSIILIRLFLWFVKFIVYILLLLYDSAVSAV